jgi:hypothetical protein
MDVEEDPRLTFVAVHQLQDNISKNLIQRPTYLLEVYPNKPHLPIPVT